MQPLNGTKKFRPFPLRVPWMWQPSLVVPVCGGGPLSGKRSLDPEMGREHWINRICTPFRALFPCFPRILYPLTSCSFEMQMHRPLHPSTTAFSKHPCRLSAPYSKQHNVLDKK